MEGARYEAIKPLLEAQPYIASVRWGSHEEATHDFSTFRRDHIFGENLAQWQARHIGAKITTDPWLTVTPSRRATGFAIFARSTRYHNPAFNWKKCIAQNEKRIFVGTPSEHLAFERTFECHVEYVPTSSLLDLAELIAGCRLFVGNQSCPFWIAAGLGVNIIQETSAQTPDSIIERVNAHYPVAPERRSFRHMNVVIPFHRGDQHRARQLVQWIQELSPKRERFYLMTRKELQDPAMLPEGWQWLTDWEKIDGTWSEDHKDASGANSLWRQCAREMQRKKLGPWLWLEPDAVPCRADWVEVLEQEYAAHNKPFMAAAPNGKRLSGIGIYAEETPLLAPKAFLCDPAPFDQGAYDQFRPVAHITQRIVDQVNIGTFTAENLDTRVTETTAIHHGCKDGSIYQFLRERIQRQKGGDTPCENQLPQKTKCESVNPHGNTTQSKPGEAEAEYEGALVVSRRFGRRDDQSLADWICELDKERHTLSLASNNMRTASKSHEEATHDPLAAANVVSQGTLVKIAARLTSDSNEYDNACKEANLRWRKSDEPLSEWIKKMDTQRENAASLIHAAMIVLEKDGAIPQGGGDLLSGIEALRQQRDALLSSARGSNGSEPFAGGLTARLDWIMERITDGNRRQMLYRELKQRGIEAGRKKRKHDSIA